jgi:hypothetical protein
MQLTLNEEVLVRSLSGENYNEKQINRREMKEESYCVWDVDVRA